MLFSFPDGLGVRIPDSHSGGPGSIPGQGAFFELHCSDKASWAINETRTTSKMVDTDIISEIRGLEDVLAELEGTEFDHMLIKSSHTCSR